MTLPAINLNGRKIMTSTAEMFFRLYTDRLAVITIYRMTLKAGAQAGFFITLALIHGYITLMQQKVNMIAPHLLWRSQAFALAFIYPRLRGNPSFTGQHRQHKSCGGNGKQRRKEDLS
jgi:hypothetical protein